MARRNRAGTTRQDAEPKRQAAFLLGLSAGMRASAFLLAKGYRIAARRWRSAVGEIDIVARRGNLLPFVEVKARTSFDDAAYSVTSAKAHRIGRCNLARGA